MEMNMVNLLVRNASVVLQDIVPIAELAVNVEVQSNGDALGNGQDLGEVLVGDVVKLGTVVLGDNECMSGGSGSNVHESEGFSGLKELQGGDLA